MNKKEMQLKSTDIIFNRPEGTPSLSIFNFQFSIVNLINNNFSAQSFFPFFSFLA